MKNNLRKLLQSRAKEFYLVAVILWLLPALTLIILGLAYLWVVGLFWWCSGGLLLLSTATWVVRYTLSRGEEETEEDVEHIDPRPDWSSHDNEVWHKSLANIEAEKLINTPWEVLPKAMLDQCVFVAKSYNTDNKDAEYAFSVPELLLMLETWSREYRAQVIENVPLVQEFKISTLMDLSRKAERTQKFYSYISPFITVLKIGTSPATGVMSTIGSQLAGKAFEDLSLHMQSNMKVLLFEQVTKVAIDLYSGRLKLSEEELSAFRRTQDKPEVEEITPLSVMIIGQINAGKSSLANALKEQCVAEISPLPATGSIHHYHMELANNLEVYLIDTPGLDGSESTSKALLSEAKKADLLLWVSQANQPAKDLDKQFHKVWNEYFNSNTQRKRPPILLVTTHNDMLPPTGEWKPPYDLSEPEPKVNSIVGALNYTCESIGLPTGSPAVPIALPLNQDSYNLNVLHDILLEISDEARAAQLNRQRLDADGRSSIVKTTLQQCAGLVKSGTKIGLK